MLSEPDRILVFIYNNYGITPANSSF